MSDVSVGVHPIYDDVILPVSSTDGSACFDIHAYLNCETTLYSPDNKKTTKLCQGTLILAPGYRCLVPTGFIFDIKDSEYSVRIHPRSGLSIKQGLSLANCEGIIDYDYVEPVFVPVINLSKEMITINHGDRICQGELFKKIPIRLFWSEEKPERKTDRAGGFGSTGTSHVQNI